MRRLAPLAAVLGTALALAQTEPTLKQPVVDTLHGVQVQDDYRWLEDTQAPGVKTWFQAQNAFTRSTLDALPNRAAIAERVRTLTRGASPSFAMLLERGGRWFVLKKDRTRDQPLLVLLSSPQRPTERILVDPNQLDPSGVTAIDFFRPSADGRRVAVSLSRNGTESGDVYVYDVATGKPVPAEVIPRVNGGTAGGDVAWAKDGRGFFYTRYPRGTERPAEDLDFFQQVYFHRLGTATETDTYELGRDFPRIGETSLETSVDGRFVLASVKNGDGGEVMHFLRSPGGVWTQLAAYTDRISEAHFGADGALYLLSLKDAEKGKILKLSPGKLLASAVVSVPEGKGAITEFVATRNRVYVAAVVGGPVEIQVFDTRGHPLGTVPLPPVSSAGELTRGKGDDLYLATTQYTQPLKWLRYDSARSQVESTKLEVKYPVDLSKVEVIREMATSLDGTSIPITILRAPGMKSDGSAPGILTGYGGYAVNVTPDFLGSDAVWVEQGGVLAVANLRGGGEYGDAWHRAGKLTRKQNVFDDFQACARLLVQRGYVDPKRLGIEGASNGGLLMGASLTQAPELFRAVVSHVGIYDMLRVELSPNGAFNVTEYGTVRDPEQFRALFAYSPYHHLRPGGRYPAVLLTTGLNDPRVDPMQSFKMTARLQAATGSGRPVLLRVSDSGHGIGASLEERIALQTDALAFFFAELDVPYRSVTSVAPPK